MDISTLLNPAPAKVEAADNPANTPAASPSLSMAATESTLADSIALVEGAAEPTGGSVVKSSSSTLASTSTPASGSGSPLNATPVSPADSVVSAGPPSTPESTTRPGQPERAPVVETEELATMKAQQRAASRLALISARLPSTYPGPPTCTRPKKDAVIFMPNEPTGPVRYPPYEPPAGSELERQMVKLSVYPIGRVDCFPRHIPYKSMQAPHKSIIQGTGREAFEVYQYTFRLPDDETDHVVLWDYNVGLVRVTPFFKALGYRKTVPGKALNSDSRLLSLAFSITGGSLSAQGYWLPYRAARELTATFCYPIRHALVPLFGYNYPDICLPPHHPRFAVFSVSPAALDLCEQEASSWRQLYCDRAVGSGPSSSASSSGPVTKTAAQSRTGRPFSARPSHSPASSSPAGWPVRPSTGFVPPSPESIGPVGPGGRWQDLSSSSASSSYFHSSGPAGYAVPPLAGPGRSRLAALSQVAVDTLERMPTPPPTDSRSAGSASQPVSPWTAPLNDGRLGQPAYFSSSYPPFSPLHSGPGHSTSTASHAVADLPGPVPLLPPHEPHAPAVPMSRSRFGVPRFHTGSRTFFAARTPSPSPPVPVLSGRADSSCVASPASGCPYQPGGHMDGRAHSHRQRRPSFREPPMSDLEGAQMLEQLRKKPRIS